MAKPIKDPKNISIQPTGISLKFNVGGLIASLIRTAADYSKGKASEATLAEWAKAISTKTDKSQQAYTLIVSSLIKAIESQLGQRMDDFNLEGDQNPYIFRAQVRFEVFAALEKKEYQLNCDQLSNPASFQLMADFKPLYQQWLADTFQMAETQAADFSADFPHYFAYEFSSLLLSKGKEFQSLLDYCKNPQNKVAREQLARLKYRADLKKKYHQPALGEKSVSLSDIYIEPAFLVYEKMLDSNDQDANATEGKDEKSGPFRKSNYKGNIHQFVLDHFVPKKPCPNFKNQLKDGQVMVLLGQPGHGKSSFCYRCMHDLLASPKFNGNVFFLRLQNANNKNILDGRLEDFAALLDEADEIGFLDLTDKKHEQDSVLFLDGLDELYMSQNLHDDDVKSFFQNCQSLVQRNRHLRIVVTSRFNYVETTKLHLQECLILSLDTLDTAQQIELTRRFSEKWTEGSVQLSNEQIEKINSENSLEHIRELIELPILLQMVVMAGLSLEASASRAAIYDKLFDQVLKRKWDDKGRLKKYVQDEKEFAPEHLREYLAFLAFKTLQGQKGFLRKSEVADYPETKDFARNFLRTSNDGHDMKQVLKDVLTSFYLSESHKKENDRQEGDREHHYVIEFLHKSLCEFLACEHLWNQTQTFFLERGPYGRFKTHSLEEVQTLMQTSYATIRHTRETANYLQEIVGQRPDKHQEVAIQMAEHFPLLLKEGFIGEYKAKLPIGGATYPAYQLDLHAFHSYTMIFWTLNQKKMDTEKWMDTDWVSLVQTHVNTEDWKAMLQQSQAQAEKSKESLDFWSIETLTLNNWLQNQSQQPEPARSSGETMFEWRVRRHLIYLEATRIFCDQQKAIDKSSTEFARYLRLLSAERLPLKINLAFINLAYADLGSILAFEITLSHANLSKADLRFADLRFADLSNADLSNAYLRNADLSNAYLRNAYLRNADLRNADLRNAYLRNADLRNADLRNADLRNADLRNAYLSHAYLSHADLSNADLSKAVLSNANLRNANLRNANLSYANLSYAVLWDADLIKADLSYAVLRSANLSNADLSNADLSYSDLSYAVVNEPDWLMKLKHEWQVKGAESLQKRYIVNPNKIQYRDRYGKKREGYQIEPIE